MSPFLWGTVGVVLMALELIVPGLFLLWFGGAALATGMILWLNLPWPGDGWGLAREVALFTLLSAGSIAIAIALARRRGARPPPNGINDRAGQLIGQRATLSDPIVGGQGRLFVGDTLWQVHGPDLPAGTPVRIVGHRGMVLTVQPGEAPAGQSAALS